MFRRVRVVLHKSTRHIGHQGRAPGAQVADLVVGHDPAAHHVGLGLLDGVSIAPRSFLCLVAVTEGASGERSILWWEVAVHIRLRQGAVARAHVLDGLLHRQIHRERIHAVDPPTRDLETGLVRITVAHRWLLRPWWTPRTGCSRRRSTPAISTQPPGSSDSGSACAAWLVFPSEHVDFHCR